MDHSPVQYTCVEYMPLHRGRPIGYLGEQQGGFIAHDLVDRKIAMAYMSHQSNNSVNMQ